MGLDNIWDNDGHGIAIAGMTIVFVTLALISLFIALLPKLLQVLEFLLPVESEPESSSEGVEIEDQELIAAIGVVLHHRKTRNR